MNMKVNNVKVSAWNGDFNYYPYGTIMWLKRQDGSITQIKVVGIELGQINGTNYVLHTYKFPNGETIKGTIDYTELGRVRASLQDAKVFSWNTNDINDTPHKHNLLHTKKNNFCALVNNRYTIESGRDNFSLGGLYNEWLSIHGFRLAQDGTCKWYGADLHFDIFFNKNKEIEIAVEEFDNHTAYPNKAAARANYNPTIETFSDDNEEENTTSRNVTITLNSNVLELLDALGINYEK